MKRIEISSLDVDGPPLTIAAMVREVVEAFEEQMFTVHHAVAALYEHYPEPLKHRDRPTLENNVSSLLWKLKEEGQLNMPVKGKKGQPSKYYNVNVRGKLI